MKLHSPGSMNSRKIMKIANFKYSYKTSDNILDVVFHASVDVTVGFWFWKKTMTRRIARQYANLHWNFMDTGDITPDYFVENMETLFVYNENYCNLMDVPIKVIQRKK